MLCDDPFNETVLREQRDDVGKRMADVMVQDYCVGYGAVHVLIYIYILLLE